ncbi:Armadillo-type fold [Arabidopsis suecica]|uniref:Armadillo-type fold n=1 Tax=Arabidopsis suecica TaxID=45249 RepID=A0A8T2BAL2_ARASU|nr:Armadillo-type fold [Arabidopsis suecica]
MKGGHRKPSKSEVNEPSRYGIGSNVVVSHASRGALVNSSPSPVTATPPLPPMGSVEVLSLFRDVPVLERQSLFLRKLQNCCFLFDFTDTIENAREKEIKRQTLLELVDFIQFGSSKILESYRNK